MINTEIIFQLDESISILYNELKPIQDKIRELSKQPYRWHLHEEIASFIAKRELINSQISNLQKKYEREMEN